MKYLLISLTSVFIFYLIVPELLRIYWPNQIDNSITLLN